MAGAPAQIKPPRGWRSPEAPRPARGREAGRRDLSLAEADLLARRMSVTWREAGPREQPFERKNARAVLTGPDALVYLGVVRLQQVADREERLPHVFRVVVADRIGEDREQILDARELHERRV